ncbi:MAG: DNA repair protein RecN [Actinomycetota bacterium]|nr:DNA repair protein RecN [Actinomycetota bacterium]
MLEALRITDLGVIGDVEVDLAPGLTVVTGETGAGKTMVVTGLQLLFGARADATRVRTGAPQAAVEGRLLLDPTSPAVARVLEGGGASEDGELVLRRTVTSAGRSRAYAGGAAMPVSTLAAIGADVWAIHGQSDQMRLSVAAEQRAALDRYAGPDLAGQLADYRLAYDDWRGAEDSLLARDRDAGANAREADLLQHGLREIEAAHIQPGEDLELDRVLTRLGAAEDLRTAARIAHDALLGDSDDLASDAVDVRTLIGTAERQLSGVQDSDPALAGLRARLTEATAVVTDVGTELATYLEDLDADPHRLAAAQSRRAELATLMRKYGVDGPAPGRGADAVLAWASAAQTRLAEVDPSDETRAELVGRRDRARERAGALATAVHHLRGTAARRLGAAVSAELAGLAMAGAEMWVTVTARPIAGDGRALIVDGSPAGAERHGADEVAFLLRAHPEAPARPVARSASGGELSRLMLALEVVLAGSDPIQLMVFDEVDSGVGGRAAVEIGRRLAALAAHRQVVVVTHLAQVAAYADQHLVVGAVGTVGSDESVTPITRSDLRRVDGPDRVAELARMLAGRDTEAAQRHARELLDAAAAEGRR